MYIFLQTLPLKIFIIFLMVLVFYAYFYVIDNIINVVAFEKMGLYKLIVLFAIISIIFFCFFMINSYVAAKNGTKKDKQQKSPKIKPKRKIVRFDRREYNQGE